MNVFVVFAHPSKDSFTSKMFTTVLHTLEDNGHTYEVSDLYEMNFQTDMTEEEYYREAFYQVQLAIPEDVQREQQKILNADAMIFVYPIFWTEAPAKLVGWFDRVWTFGFAYQPCIISKLKNVLFLACAGNTAARLAETGLDIAMERVMCNDRINTRAEKCSLHIFDGMSRESSFRTKNEQQHLERIIQLIKEL